MRAVDVVVGPGDAWVAEAKRQLYGTVGSDMVAGPSEILVVADGRNDPEWIAADLLSQAEHDATAQSILFTDDAAFADAVSAAVERQLAELSTENTARPSWANFGAIVLIDDLERTQPSIERLAPEHPELDVVDPEASSGQVRRHASGLLGTSPPDALVRSVRRPN